MAFDGQQAYRQGEPALYCQDYAAMKFLSLFSGVGGFDLALERAGMQCVGQAERDKQCLKVLTHHWPNVPKYEDVRNVTTDNTPTVDVVVGGFPCQDVSVAGRRAGLAGERSGLWFEFLRILTDLTPQWVVIENVPGLLHSQGGRDFATILYGLGECGYRTSWRVLDAQYWGVPQRRRRVFLVASLGDGRCAQVLFERESSGGNTLTRQTERQAATDIVGTLTSSNSGKSSPGNASETDIIVPFTRVYRNEESTAPVYCIKGAAIGRKVEAGPQYGEITTDVSYTLNATETHAVIAFPWQNSIANSMTPLNDMSPVVKANTVNAVMQNGVRRLTPVETERLQGFPPGWTAVDNMPDSQRYKQMGNAVAVPVAEWIARRIMAVESETL